MQTNKRPPIFLVALFATILFCPRSEAIVLITGNGSYTQNFNTLPVTTSTEGDTWTNDVTLPAWYSEQTGTTRAGTIRAGNGGSDHGRLWSFGATGSSDRALGSIASGSIGKIAFGVQFQNTTFDTVVFDSISFWGEEWRQNPGTAATLQFSYQMSAIQITTLTPESDTNWTPLTDLNFTAPQTGTAGALDGNAEANHENLSLDNTGISLAPGEFLMLRWLNSSTATNNQFGLAIDDFETVYHSVIPEPSGINLLLAALGVLCVAKARRFRMARLG